MEGNASSMMKGVGNVLPAGHVIYCEEHRIFMKTNGKEDGNKFLMLSISIESLQGKISEKVNISLKYIILKIIVSLCKKCTFPCLHGKKSDPYHKGFFI